LRPGNCLIMKNFRILHGRTSYNTNLGSRHLKVGYVGWHYFAGRINFSQYRHLYQS
ncbi:MAG: TauD/TfdA family dioxygenase, partial [Xenococcus sp. (in: cyanobacteria)]